MELMHSPQPYMRYKEGTDKINGSRFARCIFPMAARGVAIAARDAATVAREIARDGARGPGSGQGCRQWSSHSSEGCSRKGQGYSQRRSKGARPGV
jgi:hypothetical protein